MRLIDGNALKLCVQLEIDEARKIKASASVLVILNRFIDSINAQPTIEERKTGKWNTFFHSDTDFTYSCNRCGYSAPYQMIGGEVFQKKWNFCPNCGANMRGEHNALDR